MSDDPVETVLHEHGPQLSSELCRILVERYGVSPATARKRVSRASGGVKRLAYLPFPRNVRFTYLQRDYGAPKFWESLTQALFDSNSSYAGAIAALRQRGGVMPKAHFVASCGAPIAQKKHLSPETILARLTQANLLAEVDVPGIGTCVALRQEEAYYEPLVAEMRARLVTEAILLKALHNWIRNLGLGSYSKVAVRGESQTTPKVGTFEWDLTAPSFLAPLVEWDQAKPKPGFIACDVLLGSEITAQGLRPFLQKCATLRNLRRVGRCLQLFVADRFSAEAWQQARSSGIIAATPETLFGAEVAEALGKLTEVLKVAALSAVRPEVFNELFETLGRIEGAATNLRGALFEYVVAALMRSKFGGNVAINRVYRNAAGQTAEVDVLAEEASRRVHFIECKGYQPHGTVSDDEVTRWLTVRIPLVREQALLHPHWKGRSLNFELWTTGRLSSESIARIEHAKKSVRPGKYTLDYRGPDRVRDLARELNDRALIDTLEKHFLEHPLATIEQEANRKSKRNQLASRHDDLSDILEV